MIHKHHCSCGFGYQAYGPCRIMVTGPLAELCSCGRADAVTIGPRRGLKFGWPDRFEI
jgi:hypothetical protein